MYYLNDRPITLDEAYPLAVAIAYRHRTDHWTVQDMLFAGYALSTLAGFWLAYADNRRS